MKSSDTGIPVQMKGEMNMINITDDIRDAVDRYLALEDGITYSDDLYAFYYRCLQAGMDPADADRYAILNTLFGYDIGMDNARAIDCWMYLHDEEIYELSATNAVDKLTVLMAVTELELNLDFSKWAKEDYKAYRFFEN